MRFSVSGKYPERFINITAGNRVHLWDLHRSESGYTACMYMSDYRSIRRLARSAGVRLHILEKHGLPTAVVRFKGRVGVLIGACVFILTIFVMSQFIWSIDITGLDTVSTCEMQTILRRNGLYVGAFKPGLDFQAVARNVMLQKKEIGWMAVNVTGSYASVEVKEEAAPPPVEDISEPCNVKASKDGLILSIEAGQGTSVLKEGSAVIAGQLIVSGVMEDERGGVRLVHADARVQAQTERTASFSIPDTGTILAPTGETAVRKSWQFLGLRIPYAAGSVTSPVSLSYSFEEAPSPLAIRLPMGIITEEIFAFAEKEYTLDDISAEELLKNRSVIYELTNLGGCEVSDRACDLRHEDGAYTLTVKYTCVEDIAYTDPIGTDENTDLTRVDPDPTEEAQ